MQKDEIGPLLHNTHKNWFEIDQRHKCKSWNFKNSKRKHGVNLLDLGFGRGSLYMTPKAWATTATK